MEREAAAREEEVGKVEESLYPQLELYPDPSRGPAAPPPRDPYGPFGGGSGGFQGNMPVFPNAQNPCHLHSMECGT